MRTPTFYAPTSGAGRTYIGSIAEAHGQSVTTFDPCTCTRCVGLPTWYEARRIVALLDNGMRLAHARRSSFTEPTR